ncbi:MAG: TolC family protein [Bacteroidales bacterium]|nr:TolC family protein [Bacteroidales bacterium]
MLKVLFRNVFVAALVLSWSLEGGFAQNLVSLSLKEAQEMAIERNRSLQNASLDVQAAEAKKWASIASMLPQVSAKGDFSTNCGYKMELMGREIAMPPSLNLGITTSIAFSAQMLIGVQVNDIAKKMSDISLRQTRQELESQVKALYFSALVTEDVIKNLRENIASLEKLYNMTLTSVQVGVSEQTAADQILVQMATVTDALSSTQRSREMVYNSLRLQLNTGVDTEIVLTEGLNDLLHVDNMMTLMDEELFLDNNFNYQLVKENTELAKKQWSLSKWAYGPTLSAFHQYSAKKYLSDEQTMNMTPPNMVGVSLSVPIFSSTNRLHTAKASKLAYQKQQNVLADTEQALLVQHKQLCYNLQSAFDSYNTQKKNIDVMQRVFNNISKKYEQGVASAMELTNSGTNLINAQSSYVQSILEFVNAQIELEKLLNK